MRSNINILNFQKDYEGVKTFRLDKIIVLLEILLKPQILMKKNKVKLDKIVWTANEFGPR
jgi:DNA helicase-2/ATP-dependent DNA helicase PcrA